MIKAILRTEYNIQLKVLNKSYKNNIFNGKCRLCKSDIPIYTSYKNMKVIQKHINNIKCPFCNIESLIDVEKWN